jgi:hypothetical protein
MPNGPGLSEAVKRDLGAPSGGAERSRDRAPARPSPRDRERPPGENGRDPAQGRRRPERCPSLEEREEISRGIARGASARAIARAIGRSHTRSPVRSTAAAVGGAAAPTPQTARPGGACGGRGRPSSSSVPSFAGWSRSA